MTEKQFDPKMLNALDLAFVGDGVYGLLVREMLAKQGSRPVGELHRMAVEYVNATAQAAAYDRIAPMLTEQEQAVFRRGRNGGAHPRRNADPGHYAKRPDWRRCSATCTCAGSSSGCGRFLRR